MGVPDEGRTAWWKSCDRAGQRPLTGVSCGSPARPAPLARQALGAQPTAHPRADLELSHTYLSPEGEQERREGRGKEAIVRWIRRPLRRDTAEAEASHRPFRIAPWAHTGRCREPPCGSATRLPDQRQQNALETCARSMWRLRVKSTRGVMKRELSRRPPRRSITSGQVSHCGNVELLRPGERSR